MKIKFCQLPPQFFNSTGRRCRVAVGHSEVSGTGPLPEAAHHSRLLPTSSTIEKRQWNIDARIHRQPAEQHSRRRRDRRGRWGRGGAVDSVLIYFSRLGFRSRHFRILASSYTYLFPPGVYNCTTRLYHSNSNYRFSSPVVDSQLTFVCLVLFLHASPLLFFPEIPGTRRTNQSIYILIWYDMIW